jgi:hypothetical protein
MLVGPPGSGKSYLARLLVERLGAVVVQTDALRKTMFRTPRYTARESSAVYAEAHRRLARNLKAGGTVLFDATNLSESGRLTVYRLTERAGARFLIAMMHTSAESVRQRLSGREAGHDLADRSDADWEVYLKLGRSEPIPRPHLLVNTAVDLGQVVEVIAERVRATQPRS